ncbi:lysosomal Pro-X carboxypeptidase isoform X2 [Parasteatoda tepidariorum]
MFANNTGFIWENAALFNALIVFPEHRYYGESLPYGNKSLKEEKYRGYLTSEQALMDFAELISYLKSTIPGVNKSSVIAFGGSYGGMLAAWIRIKYPHLVKGAIASSAPVWQFTGLTPCEKYNEIITKDFAEAGENCDKMIRRSWDVIKNFGKTASGAKFLSDTFKLCQPITAPNVTDLIQWLYDTWSYMAMTDYPYPTDFLVPLPANPIKKACQYLKNVSESDQQLMFDIFKAASIFQNYTGDKTCFDTKQSGGSSLGVEGWGYQACTEMVMPMCQNGKTDMFDPAPWNFTAYSEYCWNTYKVKPDPDKAIIMYGGKNITDSSNIIFTNGDLDPWHGGGVLKSLSDTLIAIFMDNAAHHLDLRTSNSADPLSVKKARDTIRSWISKWSFEG